MSISTDTDIPISIFERSKEYIAATHYNSSEPHAAVAYAFDMSSTVKHSNSF